MPLSSREINELNEINPRITAMGRRLGYPENDLQAREQAADAAIRAAAGMNAGQATSPPLYGSPFITDEAPLDTRASFVLADSLNDRHVREVSPDMMVALLQAAMPGVPMGGDARTLPMKHQVTEERALT